MKKLTPNKIKRDLKLHAKWLKDEDGGVRLDWSGCDLSFVDLSLANLRSANLESANLRSADLSFCDLHSANLESANLESANLESAILRFCCFRSAGLESANLQSASLQSASLHGADLKSANLRSASLHGADLQSVVGLYNYAQVSFKHHGEYGRMLTALINKKGDAPMYQCGCFYGSETDLVNYIENGEDQLKKSRFKALAMIKMALEEEV